MFLPGIKGLFIFGLKRAGQNQRCDAGSFKAAPMENNFTEKNVPFHEMSNRRQVFDGFSSTAAKKQLHTADQKSAMNHLKFLL